VKEVEDDFRALPTKVPEFDHYAPASFLPAGAADARPPVGLRDLDAGRTTVAAGARAALFRGRHGPLLAPRVDAMPGMWLLIASGAQRIWVGAPIHRGG
jgi:hypothetical protein